MKWKNIDNTYKDRVAALRSLLGSDPYAVLGTTNAATDAEVRLAYRKKVRAYHPDRQDEFVKLHSQEVIKIVNSAYEAIRRARGM